MCGRYAATLSPAAFRAAFGYDDEPWFPPRFNIAPTQPITIVRTEVTAGVETRRSELVRWGFVPSFAKIFDAGRPVFNAWREGLEDRAMFRNAVRRRRCLVIADGYYVWQQSGKIPQPWLVRRSDRGPFGMAGLKESWAGADGSEIDTGCIITAAADEPFSRLGPRRPVIVEADDMVAWLSPDEQQTKVALRVLELAPTSAFEAVPIGPAVNKAANDRPDVQTPTGAAIKLVPAEIRRRVRDGDQGELF